MERSSNGNTRTKRQTVIGPRSFRRKLPQLWLIRALVAALVIGVAVGGSSPAYAADGDLDTTFDGDGKVTTDFLGRVNSAHAVAIQADGKIVVAGSESSSSGSNFLVARYHSNGSLDTSFDGNGMQSIDFNSNDLAYGVAIQADGKIVVAGFASTSSNNSKDFAVARLNTNGGLDTSFSSDGKVTTDFSGGYDWANGVAIQSDGKIVAVGYATTSNGSDFALARYNTNGSLDTTFGLIGKRTTDFSGGVDEASGVAIQSDGKIVAVGSAGSPGSSDFALTRYTTSGNLDTSFSFDGKVTTAFASSTAMANGLAIQSDGKIVAVGFAWNSSGWDDFALTRYNTNGTLDTSFGFGGKRTTDFAPNYEQAMGVAIQADGKVVAAGFAQKIGGDYEDYDFAIARYTTSGNLDTSFSSDGKVTTSFAGVPEQAQGLAIQSNGKIVVVGYVQLTNGSDFALARYQAGGIGFTATPASSMYPPHSAPLTALGSYQSLSPREAVRLRGTIA
ncbi:MAG TPA: delta-60 repeat domain-containing protein [Chloroflexia bacterium]|nr:delta-60 repeat domain-containing protein [Chloroflexia bacterium]